ncbi:universal stress protein UspA-like protein [Burkholderiales bacterium JOSHI_001]|nr:universal stress protein UspA-like protein [Burkholderiales bacterium JOSHI_001]
MAHPFNRLLLATEHSEYDDGAERVALAMAARCGLPLAVVLPLTSNPEFESVAPQLAAQAEAQAAVHLQALQAAARVAGVTLQSRVRRGPEPDQEIVAEARDGGSDLIVTRRRGKRGFFARLLVGEMVSRVVAHAPCSVLLVPRAGAMWSRAVLLALDPQAEAAQRGLQTDTAVAVAAECGLPLQVVAVAEVDEAAARAAVDAALAVARARDLPCQGSVRRGKVHEQIVAAADAAQADLIVMGRHSAALGGRAFLGGTAQKVIGLAERPVLVVIAKEIQA